MATTISPRKQIFLGAALILIFTTIVYAPSLHGDFLWDDNTLVTENNLVRASDGLYRFWCTTDAADYWPLTNTSFWLEWRLGGELNPTSFHVTNLLLHLAAAFLIWAILRKLVIPGAFLAALLFAVHPVNVESVAWISQRKNTLAMVFFLLSILCYLREIEPQRTTDNGPRTSRWYWLSLLTFVLAMLSKGSVAILPVLLLLLIWWQRRRIDLRDLLRTTPFFLVAILLGAVNVWFQTHSLADIIRSATFSQRLAGAGAAIWFYLAKALLPIHLLFVYPQWNVITNAFVWWLPLLAVVAATAILWRHRRSGYGRASLFAWLFFCVALAPVLGFADVGFMQFSLVADHYQHIPLIAVATLLAASFSVWISTKMGMVRSTAILLPMCVVALLAALAWERSYLFRSAPNLYAATLESNPNCWQLRNSMAVVLNHTGRYQEAIQQCQQALRSNPNSADAHFNLAVALGKMNRIAESIDEFQHASSLRPARAAEIESALGSILIAAGRLDEAIEHCQKSLQLNPDNADAHKNLGIALLAKDQPSSAIEQFREALRLNPNDGELLNTLAGALLATGQPQQAMECYEQALRLRFVAPETHYNLANLLVGAGDFPEALEQYQQALSLKPDYSEAEANWGATLVQLNRPAEAIEHLQHAAQHSPESSALHSNLGIALFSLGRIPESITQFQESLQLNPENAAAHFDLGIALTKADRLQEAADQFEKTVQLAPNNLNGYNRLISAYVQLQQSAKAIATAQRALELARSTGQTAAAQHFEDWLSNLRAQ